MVQIVRYKNRKLYSRNHSSYVTLADIRDIIKEGGSVQVTNHDHSDITAQTLARVLTDVENVPVGSLHKLIKDNSTTKVDESVMLSIHDFVFEA